MIARTPNRKISLAYVERTVGLGMIKMIRTGNIKAKETARAVCLFLVDICRVLCHLGGIIESTIIRRTHTPAGVTMKATIIRSV